jgi:hypothetical protein
MSPEEFIQRYDSLRANRPADFNQRFKGDVYGTFAPSSNIDDRRNEGLREGGLGALKAEMLSKQLQQYMLEPTQLASGPLSSQLGTDELDRSIAFNDIQMTDPAADMAFQFIDNPSGEI